MADYLPGGDTFSWLASAAARCDLCIFAGMCLGRNTEDAERRVAQIMREHALECPNREG